MNQSKIAVRYAKALFQVATEKGKLDKVKDDMVLLAETAKEPDFVLLMDSPIIPVSHKKKAFNQLFSKKVDALSLSFLLMIVDNKRENHISDISRNFIDQYYNLKGIKAAKITTAIALDNNLQQSLKAEIAKLFNTEIDLSVEVNSELIGGFVLRVGDQQIDASIANKLKTIERTFLNTTI